MNSRLMRKIAAKEHNDRVILMDELRAIRASVYAKHGVSVMATYDKTNESVRREIDRLSVILESDFPPRKVVTSGASNFARMHLAAIAAMAGIGHVR